MDSSIAARVESRSKRKRDDELREENACGPSLGERMLFCKLIRDGILKHFDPRKLTDLRYVLELRCFKGLLSDEDLRECYFERMWGYRSRDFLPGNWREMSVEEMQDAICERVRHDSSLRTLFGTESYVRSLRIRDDILRKYGSLRFVPWDVLAKAAGGALVLRELRDRGIDDIARRGEAYMYLLSAYSAGLDSSVVCTLADRCAKGRIGSGMGEAAEFGHTDVSDLLVEKYDIRVSDWFLQSAAMGGRLAMIDHLFVKYGLDPKKTDAVLIAAREDRVDVVRDLVEVYGVDVNTMDIYGRTALDWAEEEGHVECASVLRSYCASRGAEVLAIGR